MKKIILFGATGNVGSYVLLYAINYFKDKDYEIIASGKRETRFFEKMGIKYISVDIAKKEDFYKLPTEEVFAVIDLAAVIPAYMEGYKPEEYLSSIIMGSFNILEYCRKVGADRILFSTTFFDISNYVREGYALKSDLAPNFSYKGDHAVYVISKNTTIELLKHYYEEYGLKYFIFRFPPIYNYSPYKYYYPNGVKTLRPLHIMINNAMKGEDIELWGDPNYSKDMVYVNDCAQMIAKAIEVNKDTGFYNVGTGIPVTLKEQIEAIIDVFSPPDKKSKIIYRPEKKATGGFLMDVENAKRELGYEPKYDVHALFSEYKKEMELKRFDELRRHN